MADHKTFFQLFRQEVHLKSVFWLVIMVLTPISQPHFKQSRISAFLAFCIFFGDFWAHLKINNFSQRISDKRNFEDLMLK